MYFFCLSPDLTQFHHLSCLVITIMCLVVSIITINAMELGTNSIIPDNGPKGTALYVRIVNPRLLHSRSLAKILFTLLKTCSMMESCRIPSVPCFNNTRCSVPFDKIKAILQTQQMSQSEFSCQLNVIRNILILFARINPDCFRGECWQLI